jgi:lipid II:glycine glycyltransferase (peptidoglycan interpeptide bridge formation enzyme)
MLFDAGVAVPFIAEVDSTPVSAIMLFMFAQKAYYFYGMSTGEQREKMPNHLLQWEAIRHAKAAGCVVYDFWGAPDLFDDSDPMWGVFRFKDGFNGTIVSGIGAWDYVFKSGLFKVYSEMIPAILNFMRKMGRKRISDEVNK